MDQRDPSSTGRPVLDPDRSHATDAVDPDILRGLLDALPVLINAKDADSRYLFMNRLQAGLYGVTPDEARGRTAAELLGIGYGAYTRRLDRQVLETGRATDFFEETYADANGVVHDWLTQKVPLRGPDDALLGVATIGMDISERKALERDLVDARRRAEAGNRAKSAFLAQMSHELRTPMNSLIGFAELIAHEVHGPIGQPRYAEYARDIMDSANIPLALISDLLDTAAIEAGQFPLNEDWVDVDDLVLRSTKAQRLIADRARIQLTTSVASGLPYVRADERRLYQALGNLLSNALKYTPAGGSILVNADRDISGDLLLTVTDDGPGMTGADAVRVLQPFVRLVAGSAPPGAGLGLPIAKSIAEAHGGTMWIETEPGRGTRVSIRLPRVRLAP